MHLLIILQVSNKKFAHIFEGKNTPTQPRRSVSRDSHLDARLQPATGSASTSLAGSASALCSRSSRCCRIVHCFQLVSHTNNSSTVLSGLRKASRSRLGSKQNLPNSIELYRLASAGPVVSAPRTSLVGSECVCSHCYSSFVITRGSAKPSAFDLPVHLPRAQQKRKQKKWNSRHSKFSNRQTPNGTTTVVHNQQGNQSTARSKTRLNSSARLPVPTCTAATCPLGFVYIQKKAGLHCKRGGLVCSSHWGRFT